MRIGLGTGPTVQETLDQIRDALYDARDIPERGEDFADSVIEKLKDIKATIEETGRVTGPQGDAVENMHAGIRCWLRE